MSELKEMICLKVIDDETSDIEVLVSLLKKYAKNHQEKLKIQTYLNGLDFLESYSEHTDLVFLDINMTSIDGIEVAKKIRQKDSRVPLIFVTRLYQYAVESYDYQALDFFTKPLKEEIIFKKLDRIFRIVKNNSSKTIFLNTTCGLQPVCAQEIRYIETDKHYLVIHLEGKEDIKCRMKISELEELVSPFGVIQASSSFLVNINFVDRFTKNSVFIDGKEILLSRGKKKEFIDQLTKWIGEN